MDEVKEDDWKKVVKVFKIFGSKMEDSGSGEGGGERSKRKVEASSLKIESAHCRKEENLVAAMKVLRAFSSWQLGNLKLGSGSTYMSKVRGETDDRLHSEKVVCRSSSDLSILCQILANFHQWNLGKLHLGHYNWMTSDNWSQLAAVAGKGKIDKVRVTKRNIQQGMSEDVEDVKRITQKWDELDKF